MRCFVRDSLRLGQVISTMNRGTAIPGGSDGTDQGSQGDWEAAGGQAVSPAADVCGVEENKVPPLMTGLECSAPSPTQSLPVRRRCPYPSTDAELYLSEHKSCNIIAVITARSNCNYAVNGIFKRNMR